MGERNSSAASMKAHFKELGLSGKIISVLPTVPLAVGIDQYGTVNITYRPTKSTLDGILTHISKSGWEHLLVGWTGEVLPVESAVFQQLLSLGYPQDTTADLAEQLGNTNIYGEDPPDYLAVNADRLESFAQVEILEQQRNDLTTILKQTFKENTKILPVWLGYWRPERVTSLVIEGERTHEYAGTASSMLYQTLHDDQDGFGDEEDSARSFEHYTALNDSVAEAIIKAYQPGDVIWIHTHQHMLLPAILRKKLPSALIIYSQHELWPSSWSIMAKLDNHERVMTALMDADAVAVPSQAIHDEIEKYYEVYEASKLGYMSKVYGKRPANIVTAPLNVDIEEVQLCCEGSDVETQAQTLRKVYDGKKIIVTRARLDQLKGIMIILDAFRHLLSTFPAWKQRVVLILILTPDRLPAYRWLGHDFTDVEVIKYISEINSAFGSCSYQPVIHLSGYRPRAEYLALLKVADVGIAVNNRIPANDMSREFVIAQRGNHSPLLVATWTSNIEGKGCLMHGELVNSPSLGAKVYLGTALMMSEEEKRFRHKELLEEFTQYPVPKVTDEFLTGVGEKLVESGFKPGAQPLQLDDILAAYGSAKNGRLLIFDYDGTLTPIVNNPDEAVPSFALLEALRRLVSNQRNDVFIVSGRSQQFLEHHFRHVRGLGLSAEHGCFLKLPDRDEWLDLTKDKDMGWKDEVEMVFQVLEQSFPNSWIERKEIAMVWHYRNAANHDLCLEKAKEAKTFLESDAHQALDLEVILGKANLEARPRSLNKGTIVKDLMIASFQFEIDNRFVLCAGDDTTDEDMFRTILSNVYTPEHCFTCLVAKGPRPTLAQFGVEDPRDLVATLLRLTGV